ncbi:MAG: sulfate adenylyltransferase [Candidatus Marinimicrobia bacterium]|nr:sulfate adenylyltransferase [Candidatus Neomarinimicrobiota bacterium]MBT3823574.1 sulfate adenylyltransferase [Candidatus Neomarinimicrobiota bacterium]MBT4129567.1 sulfate adenylyltransferase [Candidatus Neomarinimicrobiota bacterium]MBT4295907.1 sulfate adenylyltransferase [Candidatus Neomarinimicrobiota bacterium]MBT4420091.1 sulfate adenylyltransferase [Candidatus Neomarinimicrobiota bacterium]
MSKLVPPHGGALNPRMIEDQEQRAVAVEAAASLIRIKLASKEESDLIMLATGSFSPLSGFMGQADYESVVKDMRLADGVLWPIPIVLPVSHSQAESIAIGDKIALVATDTDEIMATMSVSEKYSYDKESEAQNVFCTTDEAHPGVKKIVEQGEVYLGGPVEVFSEGEYPEIYPEYARPEETRALFVEKGWNTVAAFQTRNPIHRSHEYLTKVAMEVCDGVLIHPVVGKLKAGDIPADIRMKCYQAMLDNYYKPENTVLKVYPMEMRYGGPREAILHAIIRQNFGCSHMIIGRDHAGVGNYYGPFDAQDIFDKLKPGDIHLKPLKLDWTFWCNKCEAIVSTKTCPHGNDDHLMISGTKLRDMLANGERPPVEFGRPEVIDILIDYYEGQK